MREQLLAYSVLRDVFASQIWTSIGKQTIDCTIKPPFYFKYRAHEKSAINIQQADDRVMELPQQSVVSAACDCWVNIHSEFNSVR